MKSMAEDKWLAAEDPAALLRLFPGTLSQRKCRLFACACCRRVWPLLQHADSRAAVEAAERFADGLASPAELQTAWKGALEVGRVFGAECGAPGASPAERRAAGVRLAAASAACSAAHPDLFTRPNSYSGARGASEWAAYAAGLKLSAGHWEAERAGQRKQNASLLREVAGNPSWPVTVNPAWLTPAVVALARTIYQKRCFDALPILADALLDAGCASAEVVAHCRSEGPHARGCFVVDLLLGKP
jgi:hypothetical protein